MGAGRRILVVVAGLVLLAVAGFAVFFLTRTLVERSGAPDAEPPPQSPVPVSESTTAVAGSSERAAPPVECGEVAATDADGYPLGELEQLVRGIHNAACRGDYSGLLPYMEDNFGGYPRADIVTGWQRQDTGGAVLQTLAETLETRALADQGGHYYCHPSGAVAVFGRGTIDRPISWSDFDPTGELGLGLCESTR